MARTGHLRASDADRERAVARLHAAATEGRLSPDELDERVHAALTALTYSDLRAVAADLPREGERPEDPERTAALRRGRRSAPPARRSSVGVWALTAVRANPLLLLVVIPVVATAGAMLLAAAVTWMTLLAVVTLLGGGHHRQAVHRGRGPWSLMWSAEDRI